LAIIFFRHIKILNFIQQHQTKRGIYGCIN
jgi:hypothetical protein